MSYASTVRSSQHVNPSWRRSMAIAASVLSRWLAALVRMHARRRQHQALLDLDDRLLRDIAVTRAQAEREAGRPLWQ